MENNKNKNKGFALTEVLMAIAIIIIIGIVAYPLYSHARTEANINQVINDVTILQKDMDTVFQGQYGNITTMLESDYDIQQMGLAPDDLNFESGSYWQIPSGGYIQTYPIEDSGGPIAPNAGYVISITQIPQAECTELGVRLAPLFQAVGVMPGDGSIKGNGTYKDSVNIDLLNSICSNSSQSNHALYFQNS
jgi:type II secretory pathway pseudopilin PulG